MQEPIGKTSSFNSNDPKNLGEGAHSLKFEVSDGKKSIELVRTIIVDTAKPGVHGFSIKPSANSLKVTGSAHDAI